MTRLPNLLLPISVGVAVALTSFPSAASAQRSLLELEKGALKLMQVNDDGGLVVNGGNTGVIPASGPGIRMMWYPKKVAFRVGDTDGSEWDDANIGVGSVAMGSSTMASGQASVALGDRTRASGNNSTALGELSVASGLTSTAIGSAATASGFAAFATGGGTKALGRNSTAMGEATTAVGDHSTAMGRLAATFGPGGFAYGDASTGATITALSNEFVVRASGGFRFRTSPSLNTGCDLAPGGGDWSCTSSRLAKEDFIAVDGEAVLDQLSTMSIQGWRYIGTKARHVGPFAEDFYAAFGLGQGRTTISTMDVDGISLVAVQALERRTAELKEENAALRAELDTLRLVVRQLSTSISER